MYCYIFFDFNVVQGGSYLLSQKNKCSTRRWGKEKKKKEECHIATVFHIVQLKSTCNIEKDTQRPKAQACLIRSYLQFIGFIVGSKTLCFLGKKYIQLLCLQNLDSQQKEIYKASLNFPLLFDSLDKTRAPKLIWNVLNCLEGK